MSKRTIVNFSSAKLEDADPSYSCEMVYPKRPREHIWWVVIDPTGRCNGTFYRTRAAANLHVGPYQKAIRVRVQPFPE